MTVEDLMLDWPLTRESVVLDIGAFEGAWASKIAARYDPWMYLFEPQRYGAHIDRLTAAMQGHRYQLLPFGLSDHNGVHQMGEFETDGASFLLGEEHAQAPGNTRTLLGYGEVQDAHEWLTGFRQAGSWPDIDLASVNIEGGEYTLLPYLIARGDIGLFKHLAVQFHLFVPGWQEQTNAIFRAMDRTHELLWSHFPTWVAWRRK